MMIMTDRDALLCDLAETYQIYDFYTFKPSRLAVFAMGLREDSRIKMKLSGVKYVSHTAILAKASDTLTLILYYLTAQKKDAPPALITDLMYEDTKTSDMLTFSSGKAFDQTWNKLSEAVTNG